MTQHRIELEQCALLIDILQAMSIYELDLIEMKKGHQTKFYFLDTKTRELILGS